MLYPRNLKSMILEATEDSPVVLLNGARQTGKSTLMQHLYRSNDQPDYLTLDDVAVLAAATSSPQDFLDGLSERVLIDEIQRAPGLFLALKRAVDLDRTPGRFLLTGSANILTLPKLSDSLAGRMEIHTLWPLSQGELRNHQEGFIDAAFSSQKPKSVTPVTGSEWGAILTTGGYPESLRRTTERRRRAWFQSYLTTILQRDVRDLSNIEGITELPKLLRLLASRAGGLFNRSDLARSMELPNTTIARYLTLLEAVFLTVSLPAWFTNIGKRLVKSPKFYLNDTGLLCHLLGLDESALFQDRTKQGPVLENFVVMELTKQASWSYSQPQLYHYRTQTGQEVDIVMETANGHLVGIEVKSTSTLSNNDFRGLRDLQESTKERFRCGFVLYSGDQNLSFGTDLWAMPISALWQWQSQPLVDQD